MEVPTVKSPLLSETRWMVIIIYAFLIIVLISNVSLGNTISVDSQIKSAFLKSPRIPFAGSQTFKEYSKDSQFLYALTNTPCRLGSGYDLHRITRNPHEKTGPLIIGGVVFPVVPATGNNNALNNNNTIHPKSAKCKENEKSGLFKWISTVLKQFDFKTNWKHFKSNELPPFGVIAHSDGDILYHALTDALLGAIACKNIGELFPDSDAKFKQMDSAFFLKEAYKRVYNSGYHIGNIDCTIIFDHYKISPSVNLMRENITTILNKAVEECLDSTESRINGINTMMDDHFHSKSKYKIQQSDISIKPKTSEKTSPECIECHASVIIFPNTTLSN